MVAQVEGAPPQNTPGVVCLISCYQYLIAVSLRVEITEKCEFAFMHGNGRNETHESERQGTCYDYGLG